MCYFGYFLLVKTQSLVSIEVQEDSYLYANGEEVLVKVLGTVT